MRARTFPARRALLALPWLVLAPAGRPPAAGAPAKLPGYVVDVVARDFFLQAPDTIPAGLTTLRLRVSQGDHIAILVRLDAGHTAADLLRARQEGRPRPPWMHLVGGPGFPAPGGTANATAVLAPGHYVLLCDVAGPDGVRHFEKGMFRPLVVQAPGAAGACCASSTQEASCTSSASCACSRGTPGGSRWRGRRVTRRRARTRT